MNSPVNPTGRQIGNPIARPLNLQGSKSVNCHLRQTKMPLKGPLAGSLFLAALPLVALPLAGLMGAAPASAQAPDPGVDSPVPPPDRPAQGTPLTVTVNSDLDGPITPDESLTLREAIEIVNGTLPIVALSRTEAALIRPNDSDRIEFALLGDTRIELEAVLPAITAAGLVIDGTTQPGYGETSEAPAAVPVPVPVVALTPAAEHEVFRGLTLTADQVTVRGLSLYGFSSVHRRTASTPPADIFITHAVPPLGTHTGAFSGPESPSAQTLRLSESEYDLAPKGVVIEDNWLGVSPAGGIPIPEEMSAFGVSIFNGSDTVIQRNRIEYHESSGIITGNLARGSVITENTILGNGLRGLPAGVYFAGNIDGSQVYGNLICANDGSGVAMFKPAGSSRIYDNDIRFNGRRFRSPGISLMGSGHEVSDNYVAFQPGPGVGITAYPKSEQNLVRNNFFRQLDGLSVDLGYNHNTAVSDYQFIDGPNPPRNSHQRRRDSANVAINAPEFDAYVFPVEGTGVMVTGRADTGSEVDIYEVSTKQNRHYGNLGNFLTTVPVNEDGTFSARVELPEGAEVSAIATDPRYGTSEPSPVAAIGIEPPTLPPPGPYQPVCQDPPLPGEVVQLPPEAPITLRVPRNIHFALDRAFISAESAIIIDQIAAAMLQYPSITVELQGHTDPRASDAYNEALGERRALAARDYLLQKGIAPERMRIRSFGEAQTISTEPDIVDYARDRRVEFIFTDTRGVDIIFESQEADLQIE
ncbi:MAG: OmpA family protein [Cyanobacteria bacterium J06631_12]